MKIKILFMYLVSGNCLEIIKSLQKMLGSAPQKKVICSSDHKAAKIFAKGLGFSKDAGLQF